MSVSVSRSDDVTVLTFTSEQSSVCPPLCQLLGALCYSPALCSKKNRLTPHRAGAQTVLGALWIITAPLHIGLFAILINMGVISGVSLYFVEASGYFPVWMAVLFLFFGMSCVLSEKNPRPLFVLLSVLLNLAGVAMSIAALVLYGIIIDDLRYKGWSLHCGEARGLYSGDRPARLSPEAELLERCWEGVDLTRALRFSLYTAFITLSLLDLCLGLSSALFSIKSLTQHSRK